LAGIPGVGEKTAAKLINQYGDIDGVLAAAEAQTPKLKAGLIEHGDRVKRNAAMMVLRRDVPLEVNLNELAPHPDMAGAARMFDFLEFKTMTKRLSDVAKSLNWETRGEAAPVTTGVVMPESNEVLGKVSVAESAEEVVAMMSKLQAFVIAAHFDGEPGRSGLLGVAVVTDKVTGSVTYIPRDLLLHGDVIKVLNSGTPIVCHDAKPLMRVLLDESVDLSSLSLDTAIASYLVNPSRSSYSLASVSIDVLGREPASSSESDGQFDFGGTDDAVRACAEEAFFTSLIAPVITQQLEAIHNESLYADIENPLVRVLAKMEHVGIAVDRKELESIRDRLTAETVELTQTLHGIAGKTFNLNSPTQLREILYTERGLSPGKKTKTGFSTDAATLEKIRDQWPEFIDQLLEYREFEKLRSRI
jgi:DNA polymerase-1